MMAAPPSAEAALRNIGDTPNSQRRSSAISDTTQDPETVDAPRPPSPDQPGPNAPPPSRTTEVRRQGAHYAGLVLASMMGCLIRLGLEALTTYDGQIIFGLAWAQGVGCGIMGLALARKNEIVDIYPPLYTFLTTGIAGSVTTFSSWMLEGYEAFANSGNYNRGGLYDTVDGVGYTLATLAISFGSLYFGEHLSAVLPSLNSLRGQQASADDALEKVGADSSRHTRTSRKIHRQAFTDYLLIISAVLSYLVALLLYFLAPRTWRHRATYPILLSPPGAMLRFYLANFNTRPPFVNRFPIGTFIANISGSLIIGGVYAAQFTDTARRLGLRCNTAYAIQQGFCGCLTTVSTFMTEIRSIRGKKWTWIYGGVSVVLGHVAILVTFGAMGWARGRGQICTGQE